MEYAIFEGRDVALSGLAAAQAAARALGVVSVQRVGGGTWRAAPRTEADRRRRRLEALEAEGAAGAPSDRPARIGSPVRVIELTPQLLQR